tara:strand:+ start:409 stop:588 length:180 start_codon:yes stop_codon:yes gene_type:complete
MKITLLKKLVTSTGRTLEKGLDLEVTNDYAAELIKKGQAVEFGQAPTEKQKLTTNKIEE